MPLARDGLCSFPPRLPKITGRERWWTRKQRWRKSPNRGAPATRGRPRSDSTSRPRGGRRAWAARAASMWVPAVGLGNPHTAQRCPLPGEEAPRTLGEPRCTRTAGAAPSGVSGQSGDCTAAGASGTAARPRAAALLAQGASRTWREAGRKPVPFTGHVQRPEHTADGISGCLPAALCRAVLPNAFSVFAFLQ